MQINVLLSTVTVSGPLVSVGLTDRGKAQVAMALSISDGTHFFSSGGETDPPQAKFPPGSYFGTVMITASNHGAFGASYDSSVNIGGQTVAVAEGNVPNGGTESDTASFRLVVTP